MRRSFSDVAPWPRRVMLGAAAIALLGAAGTPRPGAKWGAPPAPSGKGLYRTFACVTCHGLDRKGTRNAPPLVSLTENWTLDEILKYLRDPKSYREKDPRLQEMAKNYTALTMPPYESVPQEELKRLAAWLLEKPAKQAGP